MKILICIHHWFFRDCEFYISFTGVSIWPVLPIAMGKKEGPSWEKAISVVWVETISHNMVVYVDETYVDETWEVIRITQGYECRLQGVGWMSLKESWTFTSFLCNRAIWKQYICESCPFSYLELRNTFVLSTSHPICNILLFQLKWSKMTHFRCCHVFPYSQ